MKTLTKEEIYQEMKRRFPNLQHHIFYPHERNVTFDCIMDVYNYLMERFKKSPAVPLAELLFEFDGLREDTFGYSPQEIISALLWIADHSRRKRFYFLITNQGEFLVDARQEFMSVFITDELAEYDVNQIDAILENPLEIVRNWLEAEVEWSDKKAVEEV